MEYTKEAMEEIERYVKSYREDLLRFSMDAAAAQSDSGKIVIERDHVQAAYNRLWD